MFATQTNKKAKTVAEGKPQRADAPAKDSPQPNPVWQSLALRPAAIQPKLAVGKADDPYEREADHIADRVMRMTTTQSNHDEFSFTCGALTKAQRKCDHCEDEEEKNLQGKEQRGSADSLATAPPIVHEVLGSSGQSLAPSTLGFMESRMGHTFSRVRVHTGDRAAKAVQAVDARAFTVGHDIVFAAGTFAPETHDGQRLIAHELAHVIQQSSGNSAGQSNQVVRRAPTLSGRKTTEHVDDSIAGDIDKVLAESPTIAKYVPATSLKKAKGHLSVDDAEVFSYRYREYGKTVRDLPDVKDVPGFTDRKAGKIQLKLNVADIESALHEAVHLNSASHFAEHFGHACNEGVTEHFTEELLAEQKLGGGRAYRHELELARAVIAALDEDQVGRAYFKGDQAPYALVVQALGKTSGFSIWHARINSEKPADWEEATKQLKQALGK